MPPSTPTSLPSPTDSVGTPSVQHAPSPLRVPVAPGAVEEVAALVDGRRGTIADRQARHAEMLAAVQGGFSRLFGRSVAVTVGNEVLIDAPDKPSPKDVDPQESPDLTEDRWVERLRSDAAAKVPTDTQRRAGVPDRRWFLVVLVQSALGQGLPNVNERGLDDLLDMTLVRAAAPQAHAFRSHQGPWADVPHLCGHAPRLLVQGQAALDALRAAGGPNGDLLFHPDLRALRVRNRQQRRVIQSPADLYYTLQAMGPLAATLPERADAWRHAAAALALAQPLREVSAAIGTARNALACLVDLQEVAVDPVRTGQHPGYVFDAGMALSDAWRAPLDAFLAQALSVKDHLDALNKAEQVAQAQVRRALGKMDHLG